MKKGNKFVFIIILGLLSAIGPLSIDMYLPAFENMADHMNTDVSRIMLSMSSFFVGISVGQLLYGPLLERFGRKSPLYLGLTIYILTSLACATAKSADALILYRFLQALGSCAGMVAARAIVRDVFPIDEIPRVFALLMLVISISPLIAPTLGAYVTSHLGWEYIFIFLALIALFILIGVYFFLPNSRKPDPTFSLKPVAIFQNFMKLMINPYFYIYALTGAIAYAGLYAYISGSSYAFMTLFKVSEKQFGIIFAIISAGVIGSAQLNHIVLNKWTSKQVIYLATLMQSIVGFTFFILSILGVINVYLAVFLIFLFLCGQGFIFPNASALSLEHFGNNAGNASALMGAVQMAVGAGASSLVSFLENGTLLPLSGIMAFCALGAFLFFKLGNNFLEKKGM